MRTIAFYSYKGGVGRSLALANFARLLAKYCGQKVFALDLDLEAPGLHYKFLDRQQRASISGGIVDYLTRSLAESGPLPDIEKYVLPIEHEPGASGLVHLLPAGRPNSSDYWRQLALLAWNDILLKPGKPGIPLFLELKERIRERYQPDYILIDSRTGVTEIGGVATTLLADVVVALMVHNLENIEGLRAVLRSIGHSPRIGNAPPVQIVPVLTRIPKDPLPRPDAEYSEQELIRNVRAILCEPAENLATTLTVERIHVLHSEPRLQVEEREVIGDPPGQSESGLREDYLELFRSVAPELELKFGALAKAAKADKEERLLREATESEKEPLSAARRAVELNRAAVRARPEESGGLARSLMHLGGILSGLGAREEALATFAEAVDLYRQLAKARPDAFEPALASSLYNLSLSLSALGGREDALAASEGAVDVYRRLAKARPDAFEPNMASSLYNLSLSLSALGRREEALTAIEGAVEVYRRLANARPDAFEPYLASSLYNLSGCLSELGKREEALAAIEGAVEVYRRLAKARPDAFEPYLARALINLFVRLSELGRDDEAQAAAEEAVALKARRP